MTTNTERFKALIEATARELYPDSSEEDEPHFQVYTKHQEVFAVAYEKDPDAFEGIRFLNDEDGLPLWIRPGCEDDWQPNHELEHEDLD